MKRLIPTLFLFISILLAGSVFVLSLTKHAVWERNDQLTFVLAHGKKGDTSDVSLCLAVLQPVQNRIMLIPLPRDLSLRSAYSYGMYPTRSIWGLAIQEKRLPALVLHTFQREFGLPVSGYVYAEGDSMQDSPEEWRKELRKNLDWQFLLPFGKTSYSFFNRIQMWQFAGTLREDQIHVIGLDDSYREMIETDESRENTPQTNQTNKYTRLNGQAVQSLVTREMIDPWIQEKQLHVLVVNTSPTANLGRDIANVLSNMGLKIISIQSSEAHLDKTAVTFHSSLQNERRLSQYITSLFDLQENDIQYSETVLQETRAEIVIQLGEDASFLYKSNF